MAKKAGRSEEFALTEAQLESLWKQSTELKDKVLVGLCGYCGLRVGEAVHLNLNWIRSEEIHIPSSMACDCWECIRRKKEPGVWKPKTAHGVRVVPIPSFLKPVLNEFLKYQPDGIEFSRISAFIRLKRLAKKARIPVKVFPHSLRASYATMIASKGMEATAICYLLGWSRLEIAQSYIRIARAKQQAHDQIRQIFG